MAQQKMNKFLLTFRDGSTVQIEADEFRITTYDAGSILIFSKLISPFYKGPEQIAAFNNWERVTLAK
jgi:hypothetical protein